MATDKPSKAYDLLIANPRERLNKWCFYGTTGGCQLCRAALTDGRVGDCTKCPIGITHSAISPGDGPCVTRTFDALEDALGCAGHLARSREEHLDEDALALLATVRTAARARRKWLIQQFKKAVPKWRIPKKEK